ncbi:MAG: D-alanyl-D-alanine carboxypeptidase family protein [Nitrospirota bacterium]
MVSGRHQRWAVAAVVVALLGWAAPTWADEVAWPKVRAKGLLLMDLSQQRVLFESNAGARLAPASLTKVMTALIAFEEGDLNSTVTISRHAARATGHRLRLRAGQTFRLGDLIDAMLVTSANDACRAVAEAIAGTEEQFVGKMNRYTEALGLPNTHFANACGFDAPGHYSTANDLARLATTALAHPGFDEAVKIHQSSLRSLDGRRSYRYRTTNRLMSSFDGAVGVKTGFTNRAGRCLIARAIREEGDLLLVMLNAPRRWWDAQAMLTRGFETLAASQRDEDGSPAWRRVEAAADSSAPSTGAAILPL